MPNPKIEIINTNCRRCGKSIRVLSRSIIGADALHAELGSICGDCITPAEKQRIEEETLQVALRRCAAGGNA
ncbi:DUF2688 domain-containing protein [Escherichia coli]|nr:DUF2688 domain-containing protein [Escherichia coli]